MYFSIKAASLYLGVSISTLRRWDNENSFCADYRTPGGHRRYSLSSLKSLTTQNNDSFDTPSSYKKTVLYSRVSSSDQKLDLERQALRLTEYSEKKGYDNIELIKDLGSGINYKKPGLNKLLRLLVEGQVERLVLFHKDRLLRFGSELVFKICKYFGVEVEIIEAQMDQSFEQELAADVIEIITVFSSKLYGRRALLNKKKYKTPNDNISGASDLKWRLEA